MSMRQTLSDHVLQLLAKRSSDLSDDRSLDSVRRNVLCEVAEILRIPFDPADLIDVGNDRIVLSESVLELLDEAWSLITGSFSDRHVTPQEKLVRQQVFFHAPHYVDRKTASKFVGMLAKKDSASGFYAASSSSSFARRKTSGSKNTVSSSVPVTGAKAAVAAAATENANAAEQSSSWEPLTEEATHLKTNVLNRLLAVDGFRGLSPSRYKRYVSHLNDRLPVFEKKHVKAVRTLYERGDLPRLFFGGGTTTEGRFSGTFYASCVFLMLLRLFSRTVGVRLEDHVRSTIARAIENTARFVEDHDEENLFGSDGKPFEKLTELYLERLRGKTENTTTTTTTTKTTSENDRGRCGNKDIVLESVAMEKLKEFV